MGFWEDLGDTTGALLPIQTAATFGSSLINARFQGQANDRAEANAWDMYQTERRDNASAHQTEVADLRKAGLNPYLTTQGKGSGVGSGTAPGIVAPKIEMPDIFSMGTSLKQLELAEERLNLDKQNSAAGIAKTLSDTDLNKMKKILMQKGMIKAELEGEASSVLKRMLKFLKEGPTRNPNFHRNQLLNDPQFSGEGNP